MKQVSVDSVTRALIEAGHRDLIVVSAADTELKPKDYFPESVIRNPDGTLKTVYHQTSVDAAKSILRSGFRKGTYGGQLWFTDNIKELREGTIGAEGSGACLRVVLDIRKPAGWREYKNLIQYEITSRGFDGIVLPNKDGTSDYVVFNRKQVKVVSKNIDMV